jgi:hypothetical protein
MTLRIWRVIGGVAFALWLMSLALPVSATGPEESLYWEDGLTILMMGWFGIYIGQFGWFANLLFGSALIGVCSNESASFKTALLVGGTMLALVVNTVF